MLRPPPTSSSGSARPSRFRPPRTWSTRSPRSRSLAAPRGRARSSSRSSSRPVPRCTRSSCWLAARPAPDRAGGPCRNHQRTAGGPDRRRRRPAMRSALASARVSDAHGHRRGPSRGHGLCPLRRFPYPAMPDFARVALILAKYAFLGIIPAVIPSVLLDVPLPSRQIPPHRARTSATSRCSPSGSATSSTCEPGPDRRDQRRLLGPGAAGRRARSRRSTSTWTPTRNVERPRASTTTAARDLPIVVIQNPETKVPIPDPSPPINPLLNPPLGADRRRSRSASS